MTDQRRGPAVAPGGGSAVFGLGFIGALVWYWQHAHGFGGYLLAIGKSCVWPAFLVYDALKALHG